MDKKTIIGFILMGVLLFGYLYLNNKDKLNYEGNPETAVRSFVGAIARKDTASLKKLVINNTGDEFSIINKIIFSESLYSQTIQFDSTKFIKEKKRNNDYNEVVPFSESGHSGIIEVTTAQDNDSKWKVVLTPAAVINLIKHRSFDTAKINRGGEDSLLINEIAALEKELAAPKNNKTTSQPQAMDTSSGIQQADTVHNYILQNDVVKITFSNQGGQPRSVELLNFKKYDKAAVLLNQSAFNQINYKINVKPNQTVDISQLNFIANPIIHNSDGSQTIKFELPVGYDSTGNKITHEFTLKRGEYMLDFNIKISGAKELFSQNNINFQWQVEAPFIEKDHSYELQQSHFCYAENGAFDFNYLQKSDDKTFNKPVDWVSVKQQFFLSAFIPKNKFESVSTKWTVHDERDTTEEYLSRVTSTMQCNFQNAGNGNEISLPFQLYYGPSDYNILKKYDNNLEKIVPYGSGIFAFVKYINRHLLLPVFDVLKNNIPSMGIVILLITLLIRLITSPILYKSYVSGAKMKVLKPEVDALREKYKDDQQAFGMEQMKLWKSAGVSPLGGCLPALLQIPIFMSLYYFFQSNIGLRDKSFLWAHDLSQYDSIAKLPFHIPFYGDHVSLFTLTAVLTSLLISLYGMSNMQDNSNPVMKYMPYIFPVLLLGVFNKLPAALTWYYTVSNTITLILQIVIQKYIIDHDKILFQINENRKKPVKKSKMQERIEAMQESQKKLQQLKNKQSK